MWRKIGCAAIILLVVGIVAAIAYQQTKGEGGFKFSAGRKKKADPDAQPFFEAAKRGDLTITVEATGTTEPISDIEVKSEATGRITEFYVEEGDELTKGELICKLDQSNQQLVVEQMRISVDRARLAYEEAKNATTNTQRSGLETSVASAETQLANAKSNLEKARGDYGRLNDLHVKGYATDAELDNAQNAVDNAQAAVAQAGTALENARTQLREFDASSNANQVRQAKLAWDQSKVQLREAEKQLGDSVIKSPIDGIVLEKLLDVGDSVVSINSAFSQGGTIVKVADLSKIQVRTSVDEIDIGKIEVGQAATVIVDAFPNREFSGKVTNVFPQGVTSGTGLISFIAIVEVDNSEKLLLGNMTCTVRITTSTIEDELLIPLSATRAGEGEDTTIVYLLETGEDPLDEKAKTKEQVVKLGDTDFMNVVVLEGLKEDDMVKVRGFASGISFE